jgi:ribulose-5-phosphate 4-epimerase/fuculose-1-phosphate aldolase
MNNKHNIDEGTIKFNCEWIKQPLSISVPKEILTWRDRMYELNLIGYYENINIGYGNISIKTPQGILISGTQTGNIYPIQPQHFTLVTDYQLDRNTVKCQGLIKASSESMTHIAVYRCDESINAIIHIHNLTLWQNLMNRIPTTNKNVAYGTPDMAKEIFRLFAQSQVKQEKILVMAGHEEGIIAFGNSLEEAGNILMKVIRG